MKYWIYFFICFYLLISLTFEQCDFQEKDVEKTPKKCIENSPDVNGNQCCYLTFKTSGKYYSFCYEFVKGNGFEDEVDRLKDVYSKVNVECLSSWISNELILVLSFFFFALF